MAIVDGMFVIFSDINGKGELKQFLKYTTQDAEDFRVSGSVGDLLFQYYDYVIIRPPAKGKGRVRVLSNLQSLILTSDLSSL